MRDERGDDLIEYALLTALIAITGAAVWAVFPGVIGDVYTSWDSATQNQWEPLDPQ
jgi:Flp pilus assembly pilin Flp